MAECGYGVQMESGQCVTPEVYTLIAGPSGSSKTYVYELIRGIIGLTIMPQPGSSAALFSGLEERPSSLLYYDEFGQALASTSSEKWEGFREILLKIYSNQTISKKLATSKKEGRNEVVIERPSMSILGFGQTDLLPDQLRDEDWVSGLMQRIAVVVARPDPERPWCDANRFWLDKIDKDQLKSEWEKALSLRRDAAFTLTKDGMKQIARSFELFGEKTSMSEGFVRRSAYRIIKYALAYHFLRKVPGQIIDETSITMASAMCYWHLQHMTFLLKNDVTSRLQKAIKKTEELIEKHGPGITDRTIVRYNKYLNGVSEIELIRELIFDDWSSKVEKEKKPITKKNDETKEEKSQKNSGN